MTKTIYMLTKQLSIFLENKKGRFTEVANILGNAGINMTAFTVSENSDFGILRIIVNDCDLALRALNEAGFTTKVTGVAAVEIEDKPGSLAAVMELFQKNNINIEYLYASLEGQSGKAVVIFKLEDTEKGLKILSDHGLSMLESF